MISSEGTELKQLVVNMTGNHSFSWTIASKLFVSATQDFVEDLWSDPIPHLVDRNLIAE